MTEVVAAAAAAAAASRAVAEERAADNINKAGASGGGCEGAGVLRCTPDRLVPSVRIELAEPDVGEGPTNPAWPCYFQELAPL